MAPPPASDAVIAEIRTNIVFEKLIVSVLTVAGIAGAAHFIFGVLWRASAIGLSPGGGAAAMIAALSYAAFFFIAGFAVSLTVGIPLFRALEKAKIRKAWPYVAAASAASFLISALAGEAPSVEEPGRLLNLIPGVAAAVLFARKMRPFWSAADRSDEAPPGNSRLN